MVLVSRVVAVAALSAASNVHDIIQPPYKMYGACAAHALMNFYSSLYKYLSPEWIMHQAQGCLHSATFRDGQAQWKWINCKYTLSTGVELSVVHSFSSAFMWLTRPLTQTLTHDNSVLPYSAGRTPGPLTLVCTPLPCPSNTPALPRRSWKSVFLRFRQPC